MPAQILGGDRVLVPCLIGSLSILNIKIWVLDMISKSTSESKFIKMKFKWHFENYNLYICNFFLLFFFLTIFKIFMYFLTMLCVVWDLSSLTRGRTLSPCIGSTES